MKLAKVLKYRPVQKAILFVQSEYHGLGRFAKAFVAIISPFLYMTIKKRRTRKIVGLCLVATFVGLDFILRLFRFKKTLSKDVGDTDDMEDD